MKIFSFFRRRTGDETNNQAPPPASPANLSPSGERQVKTVSQPAQAPVNFGRVTPASEPPRFAGRAEPPPAFGANTQTLLEELKQRDPGILAVFITGNDGRLAARTQAAFAGDRRIGASSAISLAVARKEAVELQLGEAKEVFIKSDMGFILLFSLGGKGVLTVIANQYADAERVLSAAQKMLIRLMLIR